MGQRLDLTNQRYGSLVALYPTERRAKSGSIFWVFQCDCGKQKELNSNSVRMGLTKSCGCQYAPHRETKTRLHTIWVDMRMRCKPNVRGYGAKGVTVCEEWNTYINFRDWALANGYRDDLTIDRIDFNGNYEPSNCRWATYKEQGNNTSSNHKVTLNGETHNIKEWVEILHTVEYCTVFRRIRDGWSIEDALLTPATPQNQKRYRKRK